MAPGFWKKCPGIHVNQWHPPQVPFRWALHSVASHPLPQAHFWLSGSLSISVYPLQGKTGNPQLLTLHYAEVRTAELPVTFLSSF